MGRSSLTFFLGIGPRNSITGGDEDWQTGWRHLGVAMITAIQSPNSFPTQRKWYWEEKIGIITLFPWNIKIHATFHTREYCLGDKKHFIKILGGKYCIRYMKPSWNISFIWVFPEIGVPQNGWFTMENPIKMDDLGVPSFSETPIWTKRTTARVMCSIPTISLWGSQSFLSKLHSCKTQSASGNCRLDKVCYICQTQKTTDKLNKTIMLNPLFRQNHHVKPLLRTTSGKKGLSRNILSEAH